MSKPKYPKRLFVKQEKDGDDTYLWCGDKDEMSKAKANVVVAEYKYVGPVTLANATKVLK